MTDRFTAEFSDLIGLGPIVLAVDQAGRIEWTSPVLVELIGESLIGRTFGEITSASDVPIVSFNLLRGDHRPLPVRGRWLATDPGNGRVFIGTPVPMTIAEITELGLTLDFFPEDDPWLNYLIRHDEANSIHADACARIADLKDERESLQKVRDELLAARQAQLDMVHDLEESSRIAKAATAAKSEFLANMSHEIRTPMTAILGFAETLAETVTDHAAQDAITTIQRNGELLLGIINDILDISKIEAGKLTIERIEFSPIQIIAEIEQLMRVRADARKLNLDVEYATPVPAMIKSDPTRLKQILVNLIGNAIKFTEVGGVRLIVRYLDSARDSSLELEIVDTGIGIAPEHLQHLFQPFAQADSSTTRKYGGTGLGLTISRRLADLLGGSLDVQSTVGAGSSFRVTIDTPDSAGVQLITDVQNRVLATPPKQPTQQAAALGGNRLLLAEDGPDNQKLIGYILRKAGATVTVVGDGQEAFDEAMDAVNRSAPYDVILMDMQMPVLDGYEASTKLRAAGYRGRIVALTAHAMAGDRIRCLEAGCDEYATKPIDRQKLITVLVGQIFRGRRKAPAQPVTPAAQPV